MKYLFTLIACLLFFISCNGQKQKKTSGYNGPVKKVTQYICPIKKYGVIPNDTSNFDSRVTSMYDSLGNLIEENSFYQNNNSISEIITKYSGTGKSRTFTQQILPGFEDTTVKSYKYVWSDDYHFKIITNKEVGESDFTMEHTLDKNFRMIKAVGKLGDNIQLLDEYKYVVRRNKVIEKTLKRTVEEGEKDRIIYIVTVPQEFDQYGNPTLVFIYEDLDKKRLSSVGITIYEYYDSEEK